MESLGQDLRHGLYLLRKHRGFSFVAILTFAFGIGANTALFSAVNAALFRPTYAQHPAELVFLFNGDKDRQGTSNHSYPAYVDLREGSADMLSGLAAYTTRPVNMRVGPEVERINVGLISANYLRVLGVRPIAGRELLAEEDVTPGAHPVALISESLWRHRFGGAAPRGDQQVSLNNRPRREVLLFVLNQGLRPLLWGTLLGLFPCALLALVASIEVFQDKTVPFGDLAFIAAVVAAQMALALVVCWMPARRAMRLDPIVVLRAD
jgi:putative ABC transport system permease protein